jgi:hypothetical protein
VGVGALASQLARRRLYFRDLAGMQAFSSDSRFHTPLAVALGRDPTPDKTLYRLTDCPTGPARIWFDIRCFGRPDGRQGYRSSIVVYHANYATAIAFRFYDNFESAPDHRPSA